MPHDDKNRDDTFRFPNSIIQGLTAKADGALQRLTVAENVVLMGLFSLVDPKKPGKMVRTEIRTILEIIEVGRNVEEIVTREWTTSDGTSRKKGYETKRFNSKTYRDMHERLLAIFNTTYESIKYRRDKKKGPEKVVCTTHILDSFGYGYLEEDGELDMDNLPSEYSRVNVNAKGKRPVWKVKTGEDTSTPRPDFFYFRIGRDLADELRNRAGTIGFTIVLREIFRVLRRLRNRPVALRLMLLTVRQTEQDFTRVLSVLLPTVCGTRTHGRERRFDRLRQALADLQAEGVIESFNIDAQSDRLHIRKGAAWHFPKG